jgi:hypothetical protein
LRQLAEGHAQRGNAYRPGGRIGQARSCDAGGHRRWLYQCTIGKVFEPFQSGFNIGTGLGLALVYQIIRGHQGAIRVDSQEGKGARFIIDLPREALPSTLARRKTDQPLSDYR